MNLREVMKAYKNFDKDLKCRGIQFEIGKTYKLDNDDDLVLCENGFHFHRSGIDCFKYYDYELSRLCEIDMIGDYIDGHDKSCCREFRILREIERDSDEWKSLLNLVANTGLWNSGYGNSGGWNSGDRNSGDLNSGNWNSGNENSGYRNSGDWNSGDWNSGDWNSGDWNSGDRNSGYRNSGNENSGNWNSCDKETGFFNSINPTSINVFNKPCVLESWYNAVKPDFLYFEVVKDGKSVDYKEAFKKSLEKQSNIKEQIEMLKKLPNFDKDVFFEISGIDVGDY